MLQESSNVGNEIKKIKNNNNIFFSRRLYLMDGRRNDLAIIKRVNYVLGMGRASVKRLLCCGGGDIYLYRVVVMLFTAFMRLQIYTTIVHE